MSAADFLDAVTQIMRSRALNDEEKLARIDDEIAEVCEANDGHHYEDGFCWACGRKVPATAVKDVIRMTREALLLLEPDRAEFVPDDAHTVYMEPRSRGVAYYVPPEKMKHDLRHLAECKPFGYVFDSKEPSFDDESEMLEHFVKDMASTS